MTNFRFKKEERLKSREIIDSLFKGANTIGQYPLLLLWKEIPESQPGENEYPVQFALSVSKRNFKRAVDRNFLRRRVREVYRLNKHVLYNELEEKEKQYAFMVLYTGKEMVEMKKIEKAMKKVIKKFLQQTLKQK